MMKYFTKKSIFLLIILKAFSNVYAQNAENNLKRLHIELPKLTDNKDPTSFLPTGNYSNFVKQGNMLYVAAIGSVRMDGTEVTGKVGKDLTVEQGYEAAKVAGVNYLWALKNYLGDLNKIKRIVQVTGFINSEGSFSQHSKILNGFSDLMVDVFGENGKSTRAAMGASSLPYNLAVEVITIVELR